MPLNHTEQAFNNHRLGWNPGEPGKGFIARPTPLGIRNWPQLKAAKPIIWTWPTNEQMRPFHSQMKVKTPGTLPQGMTPDPSSYFHITPEGGLFVYGAGRKLEPEDINAISDADPRLFRSEAPSAVQTDGYGHANRLLDILNGVRTGRWFRRRR